MKAFASVADNRGFSRVSPGRPGMKVRSHAALIGKKHDSTLLFRQSANLGKIPLDPLLDQRRILLERPAQRLLATQPHLRQQSTHRDRTELDGRIGAESACRSSLSSRAQREIAAEADFSMSRYCRSISTETPSTASDARSPCAREAHPIRQHDRLPTTQIPWPGKDQAHAPPPLAAVQPALLSPLESGSLPTVRGSACGRRSSRIKCYFVACKNQQNSR